MIRVAILDLYEGQANQGMRCIRQILGEWSEFHNLPMEWNEFDVRLENDVPDLTYDIYISSGGPGSPLESEGSDWEKAYFHWLEGVEGWNANPANTNKKFVFFICHSFQLVCRHYAIGNISKRNKTSFGVYPVHVTLEGQHDGVFRGLADPFYVVDSRDYQVTSLDFEKIDMLGSKILCIEKYRPHVPFEQALMGIRFNEYMIGTQFHPEADAIGMSMYLQREDKKQTVIENHGEEKWQSMIEQLNDPDKIMWTYAHVLPNFLGESIRQLRPVLVA
ncbi:type 1 glutamine amidotransferase [Flavisolibacter nicotianae]|uniref:type 1 glutamine amidotransferase n=1 Tax=Flavisolibacter nicotianae TaxID=2364882 RepID=UPI000EAFF48D|nr:GMP synthase [Flavisolibacter nicotianae]